MKLRQARFNCGFTQHDVAALTGIHQSKVSLFERGYVQRSATERKRLADTLGVNPDDLEFKSKWPERKQS